MWTAARLVSAVYFGILGFYAAILVSNTFEDGVQHTYFSHTIAAIGLWQGWMVMGQQVGNGLSSSGGNGIRTAVQIAFFGLIFFALREMFLRSADLRYNDFGRAVIDALNIFIGYLGDFVAIPTAWVFLLFGGLLGGLAAEAASRLWR